MIIEIYKVILANGFTAKEQDVINNKRLGIKKTFSDADGRFIEIYTEDYGYSILIYGRGFMNGYCPCSWDILSKEDIEYLRKKLKTTIEIK